MARMIDDVKLSSRDSPIRIRKEGYSHFADTKHTLGPFLLRGLLYKAIACISPRNEAKVRLGFVLQRIKIVAAIDEFLCFHAVGCSLMDLILICVQTAKVEGVKLEYSFMSERARLYLGSIGLLGEYCPTFRFVKPKVLVDAVGCNIFCFLEVRLLSKEENRCSAKSVAISDFNLW
ncbi:hypothetical protein ACLOJK_032914 [Asimina triloba]